MSTSNAALRQRGFRRRPVTKWITIATCQRSSETVDRRNLNSQSAGENERELNLPAPVAAR